MAKYIGSSVKLAPDCVGEEVAAMVENMEEGELIILENTRFHEVTIEV